MERNYRLRPAEVSRAGAMLTDAFGKDTLWVRVFAGEPDRDEKFRAFFEIPVRYATRYGAVLADSPQVEGLIAWVPGAYAEMTLWRMIRSGAIWPALKLGNRFSRKLHRIFTPLGDYREQLMSGREFVYVSVFGVASRCQGQGIGGRLLRQLLERCDGEGKVIYLETESEGNVALYRKFGFTVLKELSLPGVEHRMWLMAREPATGVSALPGSAD